MDYLNVIQLVCAGILLIIGIIQLVTKKCVGTRTSDYTPESIKKFTFVSGIICIILGLVTGAVACGIIYSTTHEMDMEFLTIINKYVLPFDVFAIIIPQFAILKKNK